MEQTAYEIIKVSDESQKWYVFAPPFLRLDSNNEYVLTNESNADAVYVDGTVYHIYGRSIIQGIEDVFVGVCAPENIYTNREVKAQIDNMNDSIDALILAITPSTEE